MRHPGPLRFNQGPRVPGSARRQRRRLLRFGWLVCALAAAPALQAAEPASVERPIASVIADYVQQGLAGNLALANGSMEAERSLQAWRQARAQLGPQLSLSARYTLNRGGRELDVPVGQIINPAYQTLNELLLAQGQPARFAPLEDTGIPLLRDHEQDTHLALRQPLYAPGLGANAAAARAGATFAALARQTLARELRRDIARAYLATQKARIAESIVTSSVALLEENVRINESLYGNGKITEDAVLRARAELLSSRQQQLEAADGRQQAVRYLNFLLNKPLQSEVESATPADGPTVDAAAGSAADVQRALQTRPELQRLQSAAESADAQLRAAQSRRRPTLALGVDAGTQGTDYGFGRHYNYLSGSLLLDWTLFDSGARSAAIGSARIAARQVANQREQAAARIELEVRSARESLRLSGDSLQTAAARAEAARAAFRIASRKRDEGAATQLEFLDARNALTGAELNLNWTRFDVLERRAELDFALGDDPGATGAL